MQSPSLPFQVPTPSSLLNSNSATRSEPGFFRPVALNPHLAAPRAPCVCRQGFHYFGGRGQALGDASLRLSDVQWADRVAR